MTYKDRLIAALETRRDVYAADSNIDRMRYMAEGLDAAITIARATRPDDVRPVVRARWELADEQPYIRKHYHPVACSNCHQKGNEHWHYCPNCGVDMRGENDG